MFEKSHKSKESKRGILKFGARFSLPTVMGIWRENVPIFTQLKDLINFVSVMDYSTSTR